MNSKNNQNFYELLRQRRNEVAKEAGVYKMLKSKIIEVENPGWDWFYE